VDDGRVRCSAWLDGLLILSIFLVSDNVSRFLQKVCIVWAERLDQRLLQIAAHVSQDTLLSLVLDIQLIVVAESRKKLEKHQRMRA
jgi:hypothetical protein